MTDASKPSLIVRIPTPLWLIGFIVVALAVDAVVRTPVVAKHWPIGIGLLVVGLAIAAWGRMTFARAGAEILPSATSNRALVTHGPFRFSRNPMYLGLLILAIGAAVAAGTIVMWLVPLVIFVFDNFVIIPFEERNIERQFGDAFRVYKAKVRRWI